MEQIDGSNDEIIREINVLLSPAMASQLYLMQFPLQHQQVSLPESARIKKQHNMIELDESIPINAGNEGLFTLEQRTLASQSIPVSTHMALGKMSHTGELHVVPLSHITQMRPTFTHVDEATNDTEMVETKEEEKLEKKPVLFQKKETERAAQARKSSYAFKKASEESEDWKMLYVCGPDTIQHRQANEKITCPSPYTPLVSPSNQPESTSSSFVHSLNYLPKPETVLDVDVDKAPESHLGTICAQITVALQRGWPVPFSVLKNQFPKDDQDLLTALSSCAVLVRGNFLLQSRLLPLTPALQQARTFILYLLQRVGHVERGRLERVFEQKQGVTSEAIQMLLHQVATRGVNGGWQLKVSDNLDIYQEYPEQTQLHSQYWERQETRFSDLVDMYNAVAV